MKKMSLKQWLTAVSSIALLSSFGAARGAETAPADLNLNGADCISIRTIRDYTPLSRDSLLIHVSAKRTYFVRLVAPGFGLESSFQLATRSRDDRLCPYGGDAIIYDRLPGGEARIQSISRVTPEQVEELLVRYGKKEPGDTENPAPTEVKGAEVEELG